MPDWFKNMFGFVFTQPIHQSLRQMRIATIVMLGISVDIIYRLVAILETGEGISDSQFYGAVGVLTAAVFTTIWKGIQNLSDPHKSDD